MVSRRSVRIKVMQLLYSQSRDAELTKSDLLRRYREEIDSAVELMLFALYILLNVTYISTEDKKKREAKYIKTDSDKTFSAKLYNNPLIESLVENKALDDAFTGYKFRKRVDEDFFLKMYAEFARSEDYETYLSDESDIASHRDVLLALFRFLRKNEFFNEVVEDQYANWVDDKSLVVGAIKKIIKQLPAEGTFYEEHFPDSETTEDYGKTLLETVCDKQAELRALIEPTLKNWDVDRLAIIDMILLQMAIAEFMFFPTIPTKVTLNEYVEVSKMYSTPKSKDFINGILDKLMRTLEADGRIKKEGRGLLE